MRETFLEERERKTEIPLSFGVPQNLVAAKTKLILG